MTPQIAEAAGAALVTKDELLRQADVMTIHLILSKRTRWACRRRRSRARIG
jgi:phosphoglycerate dehydrogenase-like enzyme